MRLIDANAILSVMRNKIDMQDLYLPIHFLDFVIDEMPTIDAEPVVRCKDCAMMVDRPDGTCECRLNNWEVMQGSPELEYNFCSWGESKDK